jgi:glycerol-3-phosphate acyltransferase PlsX
MKVGLDIMGGDFAPEATIKGAILAIKSIPEGVKLVLIGDKEKIIKIDEFKDLISPNVEIIHTPEFIAMGEHPAKAFAKKPDASIVLGFKLLQTGKIDGFLSAGNTGAMLVGAMQVVKSIPGIIRPCISVAIPKYNNKHTIILDVGINPDSKPDVLYQYAILGSLYAEYIYNIHSPKVGLLNIGKEEEKGNLLTKTTYQAMKDTTDFNFIGNVEGNDIFDDKVDVIVCDGFVGNVILKQVEAFYDLVKKRESFDEFFEKYNYVDYGGSPILGINAPVVIGHGISNDMAIKNMILNTINVVKVNLIGKFKEAFK